MNSHATETLLGEMLFYELPGPCQVWKTWPQPAARKRLQWNRWDAIPVMMPFAIAASLS